MGGRDEIGTIELGVVATGKHAINLAAIALSSIDLRIALAPVSHGIDLASLAAEFLGFDENHLSTGKVRVPVAGCEICSSQLSNAIIAHLATLVFGITEFVLASCCRVRKAVVIAIPPCTLVAGLDQVAAIHIHVVNASFRAEVAGTAGKAINVDAEV
jgi:hypothetical protein